MIDDLSHSSVDTGLFGRRSPHVGPLEQKIGDPPQFGEQRAPHRFGRMGREDGSQLEALEHRLHEIETQTGCRNSIGCRSKRTSFIGHGQIADAVRLFGNVGQIEVRRERPDQIDSLLQPKFREHPVQALPGGGITIRANRLGKGPDLLDQLEQPASLLAGQRIAQLVAETADIGPESIVAKAWRNRFHWAGG